MQELAEITASTKAWACYDCGKCTATCPIVRAGGFLSPRRQVLEANLGHRNEMLADGALFVCLTCALCSLRCPAEVDYIELVRGLRSLAYHEGVEPECPHGGALQSVMRMMAKGGTEQDRLSWLTKELRTRRKKGEVFFWTGCAMYYDAFFEDFGVKALDATRAAVSVLNKIGVTPVVSREERCCGHDLLWNGDRKSFEELAKHNVKLVADSGAEALVVSCAECLRTWKLDYEPFFKGKPPRILHLSEYLGEHLEELELKPTNEQQVTYQDPCRLGRHLGVYDPPRELLQALPGIELSEMNHSRESSVCCSGSTWSNCDRFAKHIQVERLKEARATGAQTMVTSCPKCQVHFRCAMQDPNLKEEMQIEMRDLAELVDDALAGNSAKPERRRESMRIVNTGRKSDGK